MDKVHRPKPPVFSFTAFSGTGKTTYIEKLVPLLKQAGLQVGVIKHDAHDFEVDYPGKDTWRFTQAGADCVAISSHTQFAMMMRRELAFDEIVARMPGMDLILTEGYRTSGDGLIGVVRQAAGYNPKVPLQQLCAVVTDTPLPAPAMQFPLNDPAPLADWLEAYVREHRHDD